MLNDTTFTDPWEAAFAELAPSPAEVEAERAYLAHLDRMGDYADYLAARAEEEGADWDEYGEARAEQEPEQFAAFVAAHEADPNDPFADTEPGWSQERQAQAMRRIRAALPLAA
jgi:hypothetical protein